MYTLNKLEIFSCSLHHMKKWLEELIQQNFVKFWLKPSSFEPIVNKRLLACLGLTKQQYREGIFVKINLFIDFLMVKGTQKHHKNFPPEEWLRHKFLNVEFRKKTQSQSTTSQKVGTKTQIVIWNTFDPNKTTFFSLNF